jgi:small subunit ribosomal protein S8
MTNYPVADFLIRLKNAGLAGIKQVSVVKTKLVVDVANALKKEKFLDEVKVEKNMLTATLAIYKKRSVIEDITIVSRPGLRIYVSVEDLEKWKKPETLILTTPKGVMSDREAKKIRVGGELLAKIL